MKKVLEDLIVIQKLDTRLSELANLRGDLPQQVDRLRKEIEDAEKEFSEKQEKLKTFQKEKGITEMEIKALAGKKKKYQDQLFSVKNNREYDAVTHEIENVKTGDVSTLPVQGVFIFIGYTPNSELDKGLLDLDDLGFVITDNDMQTSIPGVFAAGDIRSKALRQISTAVGEGATATYSAEKFIDSFNN